MAELTDVMRVWGPWILLLVNGVVYWLTWSVAKRFASKEDLIALKQEVELLKKDLENVPEHSDLEGMKDQLSALRAALEATTAELKGVVRSTTRVEDYLLNRGKGA